MTFAGAPLRSMTDRSSLLRVEVAYALPGRQSLVAVEMPAGATVEEAIRRSGLLEVFPGIDLERNAVGVFGRRCRPGDALHDGDRVEIYRPLQADPREVRRKLAAQGRTMGRDGDPD